MLEDNLIEEHRTNREISNANLKPFKLGESGNPGGRPSGESITAKLRKILDSEYTKDGRTVADHIVDTIVKEVLDSSGKYGFNTPLLKEIWERAEGKVVDVKKIEGELLITPNMRALAIREMIEIKEEEASLLNKGDSTPEDA